LKAAAAIDMALNAADTPLRLQLGCDSVAAIREHAQTLLDQLQAWEAVALDTAIDGSIATPNDPFAPRSGEKVARSAG
jgi:hypothetical protein